MCAKPRVRRGRFGPSSKNRFRLYCQISLEGKCGPPEIEVIEAPGGFTLSLTLTLAGAFL